LASGGAAVMAVGDDDQSIYGWRGAKVENIARFMRDFESVNVVRLEQNYRSTATILDAANGLIQKNQNRMGKVLWTAGDVGEKVTVFNALNEMEEARFIARTIQDAFEQGRSASDIAVLYRSNVQSRVLEEAFLRYGITYRIYGGLRYFERAEIKDALAYLRLVSNVDDNVAFDRIINFPVRGIGDKTLDAIRLFASDAECSYWQAMEQLLDKKIFSARAATALQLFRQLILELQVKIVDEPLEMQIETVVDCSGLRAHFEMKRDEKTEARLENLAELINAACQFRMELEDEEITPLVAFLAHTTLDAGEVIADMDEQSVSLMTLHAAKGLEFPLVFMVGMEEGVFPSRLSLEEPGRLEEERRLCYVGMTRAMEKLVLSHASMRRQYGREEYHRPSRFLLEIADEYKKKG
jgi:DNA helicase-2/ATP-dependent DNA helicase PcrA